MKTALMVALGLSLVLGPAAASEYCFGTKVGPQDSDLGRFIVDLPNGMCARYWDIGPNPAIYDSDDVVYLDIDFDHVADANEIRLTPFDQHPAGSKVTPVDNDINAPIIDNISATVRYLDLYGSSGYDLGDTVYLDFAAQGTTNTNDVRLSNVENIPAGSKVHNFDPDHDKQLSAVMANLDPMGSPLMPMRIRYFDVNGNGVYDYPDDVYLNRNAPFASTFGFVSVNDVRLSGPVI